MEKLPEDYYKCKANGCDLRGEPISEAYLKEDSEVTHYSRKIGHEVLGYYDGVSFYHCPICKGWWCRWTGIVVESTEAGVKLGLGAPWSEIPQ
jgi:hypothetical protein